MNMLTEVVIALAHQITPCQNGLSMVVLFASSVRFFPFSLPLSRNDQQLICLWSLIVRPKMAGHTRTYLR